MSIGVAVLEAGETLTAGLARADQALYDAKGAGRNRVAPCRSTLCAEPGLTRVRYSGTGTAGQDDGVEAAPLARRQFCA